MNDRHDRMLERLEQDLKEHLGEGAATNVWSTSQVTCTCPEQCRIHSLENWRQPLIVEFGEWCAAQNLVDPGDAEEELLLAMKRGNEAQCQWLRDFITRWDTPPILRKQAE